jgi:hypothetical protein
VRALVGSALRWFIDGAPARHRPCEAGPVRSETFERAIAAALDDLEEKVQRLSAPVMPSLEEMIAVQSKIADVILHGRARAPSAPIMPSLEGRVALQSEIIDAIVHRPSRPASAAAGGHGAPGPALPDRGLQ